jgi:hypothetical protein
VVPHCATLRASRYASLMTHISLFNSTAAK